MQYSSSNPAPTQKFTLIEFLVVLVIIGLIGTLAAVALGNARQKSRDVVRVTTVKQVQIALELYYADQNTYPTIGAPGIILGTGNQKALCSNGGFKSSCASGDTIYMAVIDPAPTPADGKCNDNQNQLVYKADGLSYGLTFCLGGKLGGLDAGVRTASQNGVR